MRNQIQEKDSGAKATALNRASIKLRWSEGEKAPCVVSRYCDTIVSSNTVYCKYAYHIPSSNWSPIPDCPLWNLFALTVIDGLLTTVGGYRDGEAIDQLFSLTGEGSGRRWTEKFPPMPTKRVAVSALCTGTALIVAGGIHIGGVPNPTDLTGLKTIEVLNTEIGHWHTAPDLREPLAQQSSLTLCGDIVYLLGGGVH